MKENYEEWQKNLKKCPFCGSENFEWMGDAFGENETPFHCHECDSWFGTMKKDFIEWKGEKFPVRTITLPEKSGGYETTVADIELWAAIEDAYNRNDAVANEIDNEIYYYCDSGFIASDPTDEEILEALKDVD